MDYFFESILGSQLDDAALLTIAEFLSTDIVQKHDSQVSDHRSSISLKSLKSPTRADPPTPKDIETPLKSGYLTKRGKNFGGWQMRYFVLDGPQLKYYDQENGVHLGSIKLPQAQIGRQNSQSQTDSEDADDQGYRHAFLILEPKRNDATKMVRHVLCSQTDEDRDEWINALLYYVALDPEPTSATSEKSIRGKRLQKRTEQPSPSETYISEPIQSTLQHSTSQQMTSEPPPEDNDIIGMRYDQMPTGKR